MHANRYDDKLSSLLQFHHRKYHYNHIMNAKKSIDFSQDKCIPVNLGNRREKEEERKRKQMNKKLVEKIIEIRENQGLLKRVENYESIPQRSLHEPLNKSVRKSIQLYNQRHKKKLSQIKAVIGSQQQWSEHFRNFKSHQKQLQKQRNSIGIPPATASTWRKSNKRNMQNEGSTQESMRNERIRSVQKNRKIKTSTFIKNMLKHSNALQ